MPSETTIQQDVQAYISELLMPGAEILNYAPLETNREGDMLKVSCAVSYGSDFGPIDATFFLTYIPGEKEWILSQCKVDIAEIELASSISEISENEEKPIEESERTVKLSCGAQISQNEVVADLRGYAIEDLTGLEQCTQLKELYIDGGQLNDIRLLASLEELEVVQLNNVPIVDITSLADLTHLQRLDIMDTKVSPENIQTFQKNCGHTVQIEAYQTSTYQAIEDACTWSEAKVKAEQVGGHLATIDSDEEFDQICSVANQTGCIYFWLGGTNDGNEWRWITGEDWTWAGKWYPGEPSGIDQDGELENRLCVWKIGEKWSLNDQRNDLSAYDYVTRGLGYMVEIEQLSGYPVQPGIT